MMMDGHLGWTVNDSNDALAANKQMSPRKPKRKG
jgi:hypothetical protein